MKKDKQEETAVYQTEFEHLSRYVPKTRNKLLLVTVALTICFPTAFGYDSMMMSGLNALPYYKDYFGINTATSNLNTASMWVGEVLSCFFVQMIADRYGRKVSVIVGLSFGYLGVLLQSVAHNTACFVMGRIFLGFGFSIGAISVPSLVSEICPVKFRGFVLGYAFACFLLGAIIASAVTYGTRNIESTWCWRLPSIIQAVPSLFSLLFVLWCPESPRFLISKGKIAEAREILSIVERTTVDAKVINDTVESCLAEQIDSSSKLWLEVFKGKNNHRRIVITITLSVMTELGGSSVCSFYQSYLLQDAGITNTTSILQVGIVSSCWCLIFAILGSHSFDLLGRKVMAIGSSIGMCVAFFIMGALIKARNDDNSISPYGAVSMIFIFQMFYSFAWTPMNYCYGPEIWPNRLRVVGMSVVSFIGDSFGLIASFTLPIAMNNMGYKFYFLNAGYNIIFIVLIYIFWVETRGIPLEEIDALFSAAPLCKFGNKYYSPIIGNEEGSSENESISSVEVIEFTDPGLKTDSRV